MAEEAHGHLSLAEVGTEEFLQKLTSQITEMVSAKITQGEGARMGIQGPQGRLGPCVLAWGLARTLRLGALETGWVVGSRGTAFQGHHNPCVHPAKLQVPGGDSDEESKTPSASPRHGRSRPSSSVQESSSESEDGDSRGEVGGLGPLGTGLGA